MTRHRAALVVALACTLALPGVARASKVDFGINAHPFPSRAQARLMHHGGIHSARFNIAWSELQGSAGGPFDWSSTDHEVRLLARGGVRALPILIGSPFWLTDHPLKPPTTSRKGRRAWRAFVRAAVARYGRGGRFWAEHPDLRRLPVRAWEIWNEPNFPASWVPKPSPRGYVRLLRIAAHAVRGEDSRARVVLAGLGPGLSGGGKYSSDDFLAGVYRHGGKPFFDVAAVNVYAKDAAGDADQIKAVARVMRHHGDRATPLWITEAGWSSSKDPGHNWAAGSEHRQAGLMRDLFRWVVRHSGRLGIAALYWFDWQDLPSPKPGSPPYDFGLRRQNGSAKPVWRVFRRFAMR